MQTAFCGAPRPPVEPAPGSVRRDAADIARAAWLGGAASAVLTLWAAAGALHAVLAPHGAGAVGRGAGLGGTGGALPVVLAAMAGLAALVAALLIARAAQRRRGGSGRAFVEPLAVVVTLLLAAAAAGHLLHPRGASLRPLMPDALAPPLDAFALLLGLIAAPLLGGLVERGAGQALDAAGASPWRPRIRGASTLGAAWARGLRLPGLLALDALLSVAGRIRDGVRRDARHRLHVVIPLDGLARAAAAHGHAASLAPDGTLVLTRPAAEGRVAPSRVVVRRDRLAFPRADADRVIELRGDPDDLRALRRELDAHLLERGRWAWTTQGRRLEAQLDALLDEADDAHTLEARASLLHAAEAFARVLPHRALLADEHDLLERHKLPRLRELLETLVDGPADDAAGPRTRSALAPAPAFAPRLERLLDSGGLRAAERLVYVPYALVPVGTRHDEVEVLVNTLTEEVDPVETRALLKAAARRAPRLHAEGHRPTFLPPPTPTAALVNRARDAVRRSRGRGRTHARSEAVELLYVPFVKTDDGWTNAVTGTEAEALDDAMRRARPAPAPA